MTHLPVVAAVPDHADDISIGVARLIEVGRMCWTRGWSLGTSSNYSTLITRNPQRLLITASGFDKGRLDSKTFVVVDSAGRPVRDDLPKPSAETLLHTVATRQPHIGAVVHTHSVWSTILSDHFFSAGQIEFSGYEMIKGLSGNTTHETTVAIHIFDNTQDIAKLSKEVEPRLRDGDPALRYGFLLRGHGLYTWGRDLEEAVRHLEVIEFLLEVTGRRMMLGT